MLLERRLREASDILRLTLPIDRFYVHAIVTLGVVTLVLIVSVSIISGSINKDPDPAWLIWTLPLLTFSIACGVFFYRNDRRFFQSPWIEIDPKASAVRGVGLNGVFNFSCDSVSSVEIVHGQRTERLGLPKGRVYPVIHHQSKPGATERVVLTAWEDGDAARDLVGYLNRTLRPATS